MTFLADRVTNVPVSFRQLRMKDAEGALQEGVVGANDLKIVQRAAGANMSVDFSVGAGYIQIDSGTRSGLAHFYNDAVANIAVTASNATNPRIDQAIVRYNDTSIPAGTGGNTPTPEILAGTATAGATLDNRTGAAALPNDCLRLADILVPATSTSVTTANIRDRRPWARGASTVVTRTSGDTTLYSATTWGDIDATNLKPRVELSGVPVRIRLAGTGTASVAGGHEFAYAIDGDLTGSSVSPRNRILAVAVSASYIVDLSWTVTPAAGSHLISPIERALSGNWSFYAGGASGGMVEFSVEEIIRPNANNT